MDFHAEKKIWFYKGDGFTVEVSRWKNICKNTDVPVDFLNVLCEYHWNVYVYIFKSHPLFKKVTKEELFDYGIDIPLHCGASYNKWDFNKNGEVTTKKIGCDYSHCDDDRFGKYRTEEDAYEVFKDASELVEFFKVHNTKSQDAKK